jgi:hypothetical protein
MKQKKKNLQKDILFILISSFVVVVAWVSFNIYHIYATSTLSQDLQSELTPIDPVFDPQTMEQLKTRENIQPLFESQKSAITIAPTQGQSGTTPTPTPLISGVPSQTASDASQLTPSNSPIDRVGQ